MWLFFLSPTSNLKWLKNKLHRRVAWQPIHQCHVRLGLVGLLRSLRELHRNTTARWCWPSLYTVYLCKITQRWSCSFPSFFSSYCHSLPSCLGSHLSPAHSLLPCVLCFTSENQPMFAFRAYDFNSLFNNVSCCLQTVKKPSLSAVIFDKKNKKSSL